MGIAEEIATVEREFVSGKILLEALIRQEGVSAFHVAKWFVRNIDALDEIPMIQFSRELRDFESIESSWACELFLDIASEPDLSPDWMETEGYVGGWLSTDLKSFFSRTQVDFPELAIREILKNEVPPLMSAPENFVSIPVEAMNSNLATRERGSLLTIIAALAEEARIPLVSPSKAADLISSMTQKMGATVAKRTIEEHLKKIPDALERRMK